MPTESRFELPELTLAAREWGTRGDRPVIALHGWLDNAASFDLLAPLLERCHVVAVDAAGHGHSGRRSPDARYGLLQEVTDLFELAEHLGWSSFTLLGHSRGAAVATLFAGTFPERVDRLVLIEGGIPLTSAPDAAPDDLATAIDQLRRLRTKTGRLFPDRDAALRERANGFTSVTLAAAAVLATRGLTATDGGFRWHADQRLKARSESRLTTAQAHAFLDRVRAPTLAVLADRSPFAGDPAYRALLRRIADVRIVELAGGHHLHLEGAEAAIAAHVLRFIAGDRTAGPDAA